MDSSTQSNKFPPSAPPHVLIFPFPVQGHVNSMLKLAELLCLSDLKVTFLNSAYNHQRLLKYSDIQTRFARYPNFRFETIPDGLPGDHPRSGPELVLELYQGVKRSVKPHLTEILMGNRDNLKAPVTCLIVDGIFGLLYELGKQVRVPVVAFRTISACCFWIYLCVPRLIEAGHIPFKDDELDELIKDVPGMEEFLRYRDLPSFCRVKDATDPTLKAVTEESIRTSQAHSLILNTTEELEGPIVSHIRAHCCPNTYTIGPLPAQLKFRADIKKTNSSTSNNHHGSLWEVNRSCIKWLDEKPTKSVVYVSFGSMTVVTRAQMMEFWAGLVQSEQYFLWVVRPDSIIGESEFESDQIIPEILTEGTKERGCMVEWVPQEEVLAHRAVGGFLTHSGWNSTLESIVAGVPMACWPYFADQQINSRYVSEVWKVGLDMKDKFDNGTVEKVVRDLMNGKRDELESSMVELSRVVRMSVESSGGSSHRELDRLVRDIRSMSGTTPSSNDKI